MPVFLTQRAECPCDSYLIHRGDHRDGIGHMVNSGSNVFSCLRLKILSGLILSIDSNLTSFPIDYAR